MDSSRTNSTNGALRHVDALASPMGTVLHLESNAESVTVCNAFPEPQQARDVHQLDLHVMRHIGGSDATSSLPTEVLSHVFYDFVELHPTADATLRQRLAWMSIT